MVIYIVYESCWQNSFLDGTDEQAISKDNPRKFKATSKSKVIDTREIGLTTVLGVLCRLIGDQRKLYQARQADDYYFKDIEQFIQFSHREKMNYSETAFVVNKSEDRPPQSSFSGVLPDDTYLFFSEYSKNLWSILDFNLDELLNFILKPKANLQPLGKVSPNKHIRSRIEAITGLDPIRTYDSTLTKLMKSIELETNKHVEKLKSGKKITEKEKKKITQLEEDYTNLKNSNAARALDTCLLATLNRLKAQFPDKEYLTKDLIYPMSLYSAALYIMLDELKKSGINISGFTNKNGNIQGFHSAGFNGIRDFLNPLAGGKKRCGGTPTELTKTSGILTIDLNIPLEKVSELEEMIEAAGVSSFYLGKKGLAYACVNKLRI